MARHAANQFRGPFACPLSVPEIAGLGDQTRWHGDALGLASTMVFQQRRRIMLDYIRRILGSAPAPEPAPMPTRAKSSTLLRLQKECVHTTMQYEARPSRIMVRRPH